MMLEPSWRDDIAVVVPLLLGVVVALDEEPAGAVIAGAGSEGNAG